MEERKSIMALKELSKVQSNEGESQTASPTTRRPLIDADAHLDPPHEMWANYLPAHLRDKAPYIEEGEEHDWVVFEGKRRPVKQLNNTAGKAGKDFKVNVKRSELRQAWLPDQRLADMDRDGVEAAVIFGGGPLGTTDSELYIASFETYNRWLWDFCGTDRSRLQGVAYLPMRDVDETIGLMRQAAKLGFRTVNIPAFPQSADGISTSATVKAISAGQGAALTGNPTGERSYRDPEFERFWAEVCELDLTVTVHLGARVPRFGEKQHFLPDMLMSKLSMAEPIAVLIFGGIFHRFPKLRFVTVESGVGWFAWAAEYMDRTWERQRFWTESPIPELPSHYMEQNVYGSFIQDRIGILQRNLPGGRNIMWSSDYPHSETSWPESHDILARDFAGVPDKDVHDIVYARAKRLYQIG
jgi:predicted TIM-barrel fold metal-dependent hydrolase